MLLIRNGRGVMYIVVEAKERNSQIEEALDGYQCHSVIAPCAMINVIGNLTRSIAHRINSILEQYEDDL